MAPPEADVHQHQVRTPGARQRDGLLAARGDADDRVAAAARSLPARSAATIASSSTMRTVALLMDPSFPAALSKQAPLLSPAVLSAARTGMSRRTISKFRPVAAPSPPPWRPAGRPASAPGAGRASGPAASPNPAGRPTPLSRTRRQTRPSASLRSATVTSPSVRPGKACLRALPASSFRISPHGTAVSTEQRHRLQVERQPDACRGGAVGAPEVVRAGCGRTRRSPPGPGSRTGRASRGPGPWSGPGRARPGAPRAPSRRARPSACRLDQAGDDLQVVLHPVMDLLQQHLLLAQGRLDPLLARLRWVMSLAYRFT